MRASIGLVCLAFVLMLGCWACRSRSETVARVKPRGQAVSTTSPKATETVTRTAPQVQNPPLGSFDWAGFTETGVESYAPLTPGRFDPDDHSGDDVVTSKYPIDSPNRPAANEDGSEPQTETDSEGKQWAVYRTRRPNKGRIWIESINLHPTWINGRSAIFGSVMVSNMSSYNVVGLQLVYVSGTTRTTVLTVDRAKEMIGEGIPPRVGLGLKVKSVVVDEDKTVPALLLEAQIDGPPGLVTDQATLREVMVNSAGQEVGPRGQGY